MALQLALFNTAASGRPREKRRIYTASLMYNHSADTTVFDIITNNNQTNITLTIVHIESSYIAVIIIIMVQCYLYMSLSFNLNSVNLGPVTLQMLRRQAAGEQHRYFAAYHMHHNIRAHCYMLHVSPTRSIYQTPASLHTSLSANQPLTRYQCSDNCAAVPVVTGTAHRCRSKVVLKGFSCTAQEWPGWLYRGPWPQAS